MLGIMDSGKWLDLYGQEEAGRKIGKSETGCFG